MSIGIGYNPLIITDPDLIPSFVDFVECGPFDLDSFDDHRLSGNLSVHIATSPMCERSPDQDYFIGKLESLVQHKQYVSMGVHITGPRFANIGRYGFPGHYDYSRQNEERIIRFVKSIQDRFGKPVWLENVNFYSKSQASVFRTHESINRICELSGARMIADITHLYVDAFNVGIDPCALIGAIHWSNVEEVHLAGTVTSSDGVQHDGHSQPVPGDVWDIFESIVDYRLIRPDTIVTIEHTDPDWASRKADFRDDYIRASEIKQRLGDAVEIPYQL